MVATTPASEPAAPTTGYVKRDSDLDNDSPGKSLVDKDDSVTTGYGHAASAAESRQAAATIKGYYTAAADGDGAAGCSLMYSLFAETIPETYGAPPAGPPELRGRTCAVVMSKFFKLHHHEFVAKAANVQVVTLRAEGNRGWAVLRFSVAEAVQRLLMHRERGVWRVAAMLDTQVP